VVFLGPPNKCWDSTFPIHQPSDVEPSPLNKEVTAPHIWLQLGRPTWERTRSPVFKQSPGIRRPGRCHAWTTVPCLQKAKPSVHFCVGRVKLTLAVLWANMWRGRIVVEFLSANHLRPDRRQAVNSWSGPTVPPRG
jgi:hypothetical protein